MSGVPSIIPDTPRLKRLDYSNGHVRDAIGFEAPERIIEIKTELSGLTSLASLLVPENETNTANSPLNSSNPENSIWWYIMPTSGFALLLALYFIRRRRK